VCVCTGQADFDLLVGHPKVLDAVLLQDILARAMVMVLKSNGCGVKQQRLGC
jgi:hypothetical protein